MTAQAAQPQAATPPGSGGGARSRARWSGQLPGAVIAILLFASALSTQYARQEVRYTSIHHALLDQAETFYVPPTVILKTLSLGYQDFIADLLYIRAHHYFIDHLFADRRYQYLDAYLGAVLELDPHIGSIYKWASLAAKLGQRIDNTAVERSTHYAELGLKVFPQDWELYTSIGYNWYFEYKPTDDADRERAREKAREYFTLATAMPGSRLDPNFITQLFLNDDDTALARFVAYRNYERASDEEREQLINRLIAIEEKGVIEALRRDEEAYKRDFAFVPRSFFDFIGPLARRRVPLSLDDMGAQYLGPKVAPDASTAADAPAPAAAPHGGADPAAR